MTDIIKAILDLAPNAQVSVTNESLDSIIWHDGNPNNITNDQITAKQAELQADYDAKQYQRDRAKAYKPLEDQLDMQYWDNVNSTTIWKDHIAKVKDAFLLPLLN